MTEIYDCSSYSKEEEGLIKENKKLEDEIRRLKAAEKVLLEAQRVWTRAAQRGLKAEDHIQALIDIIESEEVSRLAHFAHVHNQGFDPEESKKNQKVIEAAKKFLEE
jgi:endonuclease IV